MKKYKISEPKQIRYVLWCFVNLFSTEKSIKFRWEKQEKQRNGGVLMMWMYWCYWRCVVWCVGRLRHGRKSRWSQNLKKLQLSSELWIPKKLQIWRPSIEFISSPHLSRILPFSLRKYGVIYANGQNVGSFMSAVSKACSAIANFVNLSREVKIVSLSFLQWNEQKWITTLMWRAQKKKRISRCLSCNTQVIPFLPLPFNSHLLKRWKTSSEKMKVNKSGVLVAKQTVS